MSVSKVETFLIRYQDPETGQMVEETRDFKGCKEFPPEEWAKDYAYSRADKGLYKIKKVTNER